MSENNTQNSKTLVSSISPAKWVEHFQLLPPGQRAAAFLLLIIQVVTVIIILSPFSTENIRLVATIGFFAIVIMLTLLLIKDNSSENKFDIPNELQGSAIYFDNEGLNDSGVLGEHYITAMNLKFVGHYVEAIEHYNKVAFNTESVPDPTHLKWKSHYNIGSSLLYSGQLNEAVDKFFELIDQLSKTNWRSDSKLRELLHGCYIQLNQIYDKEKDYDKGASILLESLQIKPNDPLSYLNLALITAKNRKFEEAKKWLKILNEHPSKNDALKNTSIEDKEIIYSIKNKVTKRKIKSGNKK